MLQVNCSSVQPMVQIGFPGFPGDCVGREHRLHSLRWGNLSFQQWLLGEGGGRVLMRACIYTYDRQSCTCSHCTRIIIITRTNLTYCTHHWNTWGLQGMPVLQSHERLQCACAIGRKPLHHSMYSTSVV